MTMFDQIWKDWLSLMIPTQDASSQADPLALKGIEIAPQGIGIGIGPQGIGIALHAIGGVVVGKEVGHVIVDHVVGTDEAETDQGTNGVAPRIKR